MTLNLLRDDPDYIIDNVLHPLKLRIFQEKHRVVGKKAQYKYNSFTFGLIGHMNSPSIIDELIADIKSLKDNSIKVQPLRWSE